MTKTEIIRQKLREAYDSFVSLYGMMNKARNRNIINKDVHGFLILSSLEKKVHNEYEPADVLYKSTKHIEDVFTTTSCSEALVYVLGKIGRVSIGQIAEITDKEEEDVINELGTLIYVDPSTNKWVTADAWLSGNVYQKLQTAKRVHAQRPEDRQVKRSLDAIQENQPEPIPFELIEYNLGERWVPHEYYRAFLAWFFKANDVVFEYFPSMDEYQVDFRFGYWGNTTACTEYIVRSKGNTTTYGHELMKHAMENTTPIYTYSSGTDSLKDNDAIQLAADKIDNMRKKWQEWLYEICNEEEKQRLADLYNSLYNCFVLRQFNGSHQTFPGLDLSKLGKDKTPITLYGTQKNAIWRLIQNQGGIIDHEVGLGKAQPLDSKILTPTGWKLMGEIKTGDSVISVDGKATKVSGVFPQGKKPIYRVTMNDGSFTECCEDHLWNVNDTTRASAGKPYITLSIKDMLSRTIVEKKGIDNDQTYKMSTYYRETLHGKKDARHKWMIPVVDPVQFEEKDVFIHPYILGALIGDGSLAHPSVQMTSADEQLIDEMRKHLPSNYSLLKSNSKKYGYIFKMEDRKTGKGSGGTVHKIRKEIERLGLKEKSEHKYIPDVYKFNTVENRIALLQGLMDTDGTVGKNTGKKAHLKSSNSSFCTVSEQLCNDVVFLVQSLGGVAKVHSRYPTFTHKGEHKIGQKAYNINVSLPPMILPFRLKRKLELWVPKSKYKPNRFISNIELIGEKEAQCIKVEHSSQLYVTDACIVTHNTNIAIIAAYEMKRLGIKNKPAILCLKANVAEVASTYRMAYPSARILAPDEKDFEPANRRRLFHEIKNNDWDSIILSHDQFGKIQQSIEIQKEVLSEEIEALEKDLEQARNSGYSISKKMSKGLENRKKTLEVKLKTAMDKIGKVKDEDITFRDMGIDHLLIDEAHQFKNLTFTTRHDRVAGLGNQEGSQKALNMLFAIRELQKMAGDVDLQTTFLSGTPISNSLTEMYLLFKYLRPNALKRQNITNFDSWAAVYAKKTTDYEFSVTNQIIAKERFRHFIKVPELALFYNEIADYKTKKMAGIDEPEMIEQLVPLTPTPDQQDYIQRLIKFAESGQGHYIFRDPLTDSEMSAKMLIATNCAKKMSTDMRLIDQFRYEDHPDSKLHVCATKVAEFYYRFMAQKGTQIIFCDVGTPNNDKIEVESFNSIEIVTTKRFNVYDAMRDKLVDEFGLKKEEIVFIHDYQTDKKKHELFRRVNSGEVRVLLGSTDKAGTGLNVQQRVVAMHHLDIPWKPSQLTQRNGRGVRPGNWLAKQAQDNKVYVFVYAVERSLDTYKFTLLKNKQTFISQMKNNELQTRSIDEGSIDESSGMNFAEYIAVLSGDNSLLERAKADKKVALLENLRNVHYKEQHNNKHSLVAKKDRKVVVDQLVTELTRDVTMYQELLEKDPETGSKKNKLLLYGTVDTINKRNAAELRRQIEKQETKLLRSLKMKVPKKIEDEVEEGEETELKDVSQIQGEYLLDVFRNYRPAVGTYREKIGEIYGFDVWIERVEAGSSITDDYRYAAAQGSNVMSHNKVYAQHPEGTIKYHHNHGSIFHENSKVAARNLILAIDKSEGLLYNTYSKEQETLERDINHLSSLQYKPFDREEELQQLKDEVKRLSEQIKQSIEKPKEKEEPVEA